jgi:hypothetical protein
MRNQLPEKWAIECTKESQEALTKFYQTYIDEYKGCKIEFKLVFNAYLHYPQYGFGCHSRMNGHHKDYTVISYSEFCKLVLNKTQEPLIFN